tara:strand:+ start:609 stop:1142 length:534 start_codon:yes stop_codon:yes gene_type:complete
MGNIETKENNDFKALTEGAAKIDRKAKERKINSIIFWFALICILSGSSIVGYVKQDFIIGWFENPRKIAYTPSSNTVDDSELDHNAEKEKLVEQITEEEIRTKITNKASYYAVVGSFYEVKNAKNLVKLIKEEGYNDVIIFQNGNLKSVSLGIFSTLNEAQKALKQSGRNGWVKKTK